MRFNYELLKELRGKEKLSKRKFAVSFKEKTGVSISREAMATWVKEKHCPTFNSVLAIAKYFDRPITDFIKED